ncbi:MAG: hypothetical protein NXH87_13235 [Rhodobiaceae bacterium]|nr:hypothetical protein [Rhodobiaceae bacterium]
MFLVIGWTIISAFIATTFLTILALSNVIELSDEKYLDRLFVVLVLEIVASGFFIFREGFSEEQKYFRNATLLFDKAISQKEAGSFKDADETFSQILNLSTDKLPFDIRDVIRQRADLAFSQNLWERAAASYQVYDEMGPGDPQVLANYGRSLRELNRYEEAKLVYQRAEKFLPNDYAVLNGLNNVTRRLASFYLEADRSNAAQKLFEQTRVYINAMLKIAGGKSENERQYLNALIARVRLNWQWERYPEAEASTRGVIEEFPDFSPAKEDLAAILLEYGLKTSNQSKISESAALYRKLHEELGNESDDIFIGSGLAEAVASIESPTTEYLEYAKNAVLLSIANNENTEDDPYAFYAAALLFHKFDDMSAAQEYLRQAISAEERRSADPYTFDYRRLVEYEKLLLRWTELTQ